MNGNCLDIGTIQAFLDGETRGEDAIRISGHLADCDACTMLMATAEEEASLVYSVLDRELNTLVPTQRLWTRINETITVEKSSTSFWNRLSVFISSALFSPSYAAAAGLLLVLGATAIVFTSRTDTVDTNIAELTRQEVSTPASGEVNAPQTSAMEPVVAAAPKSDEAAVTVTNYSSRELERMIRADNRALGTRQARSQRVSAGPQYLPGEETYVRTISDLQQNESVSPQSISISASSQVSLAKDLAMVDESIKRMREVVRKNPRNQAARQVLYSSYQDKIDLLKSSSQRDDLIASLQ